MEYAEEEPPDSPPGLRSPHEDAEAAGHVGIVGRSSGPEAGGRGQGYGDEGEYDDEWEEGEGEGGGRGGEEALERGGTTTGGKDSGHNEYENVRMMSFIREGSDEYSQDEDKEWGEGEGERGVGGGEEETSMIADDARRASAAFRESLLEQWNKEEKEEAQGNNFMVEGGSKEEDALAGEEQITAPNQGVSPAAVSERLRRSASHHPHLLNPQPSTTLDP